ncbi:C2H2-type domain-containing protein [Fusarium sp. Ph1]|nr:C2H2-type domain-containing protein [Fusarium sp. Ph1]
MERQASSAWNSELTWLRTSGLHRPGGTQIYDSRFHVRLQTSYAAALTKQIDQINLEMDVCEEPEDYAQLEAQRKAAYKERRLLEKKKLKEFQANQKLVYETEREDYEQSDWRQSHFNRISHLLPEERVRLAHTLQLQAWPRSSEWISALRDLISLRTNDFSVAYQEELRPIQGYCPVSSCGQNLTKLPKTNRWRHVYRCFQIFHLESSGFAKFCFSCSTWLNSKMAWQSHCEDHMERLTIPMRCNPVSFRHAIACAGHCLVHLGRSDLPAEERMRQWSDLDAWKRHLLQCLSAYLSTRRGLSSLSCPHPKCPTEVSTEKDFRYHLSDIHSIPESPETRGKRKACLEEDQDSMEPARVPKRMAIGQSEDLMLVPFSSIKEPNAVDSSHELPLDAFSHAAATPSSSESESPWNLDQSRGWEGDLRSSVDTPESSPDCSSCHSSFEHNTTEIKKEYTLQSQSHNNLSSSDTVRKLTTYNAFPGGDLDLSPNVLSPTLAGRPPGEVLLPIDPLLASASQEHMADCTRSEQFSPSDPITPVSDPGLRKASYQTELATETETEYPIDRLLGRWGKSLVPPMSMKGFELGYAMALKAAVSAYWTRRRKVGIY